MADEELEAIRQQRLAELQAKHGVSNKLAVKLNQQQVIFHPYMGTHILGQTIQIKII